MGGVTVSQTIDMSTTRGTVGRATGVKVLWCEEISEPRGRLHISALFRVSGSLTTLRDDSLKLESGNLTSDLTPDFTDCGGDPKCGERQVVHFQSIIILSQKTFLRHVAHLCREPLTNGPG